MATDKDRPNAWVGEIMKSGGPVHPIPPHKKPTGYSDSIREVAAARGITIPDEEWFSGSPGMSKRFYVAAKLAAAVLANAKAQDVVDLGGLHQTIQSAVSLGYMMADELIARERADEQPADVPQHRHVSRGDGTDKCQRCGRDIRDDVHTRVPQAEKVPTYGINWVPEWPHDCPPPVIQQRTADSLYIVRVEGPAFSGWLEATPQGADPTAEETQFCIVNVARSAAGWKTFQEAAAAIRRYIVQKPAGSRSRPATGGPQQKGQAPS